MKKVITLPLPEIAEYTCDGCNKLVTISGIPLDDPRNVTNKEFCVQLRGDFPLLVFDLAFCQDCGMKLVEVIEREFRIKIQSNIFDNVETPFDDNSESVLQ